MVCELCRFDVLRVQWGCECIKGVMQTKSVLEVHWRVLCKPK